MSEELKTLKNIELLLNSLVAHFGANTPSLPATPEAGSTDAVEEKKPKTKPKAKAKPKAKVGTEEKQDDLPLEPPVSEPPPETQLTAEELNKKLMAILQANSGIQDQVLAFMESKGGKRISLIDPEHYSEILYFAQSKAGE